jgi:predicted nucleic acid-binding protein
VTVFIDTNVLVYEKDVDQHAKRRRAREYLASVAGEAFVSTQVLIEFHSVLTRRLGKNRDEASEHVAHVPFEVVGADRELVQAAAATAAAHQLSIYDAMIIEAAVRGGCDTIWTEDLADGSTIRGVTIANPFADLK